MPIFAHLHLFCAYSSYYQGRSQERRSQESVVKNLSAQPIKKSHRVSRDTKFVLFFAPKRRKKGKINFQTTLRRSGRFHKKVLYSWLECRPHTLLRQSAQMLSDSPVLNTLIHLQVPYLCKRYYLRHEVGHPLLREMMFVNQHIR